MFELHVPLFFHNAPKIILTRYDSTMSAGYPNPEIEVKRAPNLLIILGALAQIHVNFVGEIFLAELFLYTIWIFRKKHLRFEKKLFVNNSKLAIFQKLLMFALAAQLITDVLRGVNYLDIARGSSLILFTILNLRVIFGLSMHYAAVGEVILLGYAFSFFVGAIIQPNEYFKSYPWKFGFAYGTTLLFFILLQRYFIRNKIVAAFFILAYVGINFALDTRSLGLVILIAGVIYFLNQYFKKSKINTVIVLITTLILTPTLYTMYVSGAAKGSFGTAVQQKYLMQSQNTKNLFYGGRTDVFVGFSQVKKSPLVGQGSYAKISASNRQEILTEIVGTNPNLYPLLFSYKEGNLIPIHSILFQFWVWYGIVGALAWLWYLFSLAWILRRDLKTSEGVSLVNCYLITLTVWDIFFSPFGGDRRFAIPLFLIVILNSRPEAKCKSSS